MAGIIDVEMAPILNNFPPREATMKNTTKFFGAMMVAMAVSALAAMSAQAGNAGETYVLLDDVDNTTGVLRRSATVNVGPDITCSGTHCGRGSGSRATGWTGSHGSHGGSD